MKNILFILLFGLASGNAAKPQDWGNPSRMISGQRADLMPLIVWWTNAEVLRVAEHNRNFQKKPKPLPARPLAAWVRITTSDWTNSGIYCVATVRIEAVPGDKPEKAVVVLKHAPVNFKARFDNALATANAAHRRADNADSAAEFHNNVADEHRARASIYNEVYGAGGEPANRVAAQNREAQMRAEQRAAARAEQSAARARNVETQATAVTKGQREFRLDTFALKTGETYNGLPVYDLGLAFGQ